MDPIITSAPTPAPVPEPPKKPYPLLLILLAITSVVAISTTVGLFWWHTTSQAKLKADYEGQLSSQSQAQTAQTQQLEQEKMDLEKRVDELGKLSCAGIWEDGKCNTPTCTDSDINDRPNDIFIKGTVSYTSLADGRISKFVDECQGTGSVIEYICKESREGSGIYDARSEIFPCPAGCLDGVCKQ